MATDKHGRELKVGDKVLLECEVVSVSPSNGVVLEVNQTSNMVLDAKGREHACIGLLTAHKAVTKIDDEELTSVGELGAHLFTRRNQPL